MVKAADIRDVGPYRVLAELGRGGMGRVLLGSGPDGRLVAVKLVHHQFAHDEGFRARFRREVEASRAVSGAYTAAIVDADPDAPTPWLASVFVPGPSLHDALTEVGPLPEAAVLRLVAGLATALTHIHRAGLVHRDLKPANVLLTDDGPRVIDFGIVRAISDGRHDELTQTGWLVGSPAFMSPEQADGATVTAAGDLFSLGSVVVAAATGASPFTGAATLHTLNNVVRLDPDLADVPESIRRIVKPCLAKDPAARPTAEELLASVGQLAPSARPWPDSVHQLITRRQAEIAEFLEPGQDATVLLTERPPTSTLVAEPTPLRPTLLAKSPSARRWPLIAAAAVVVVVLIGALVWATLPETEQKAAPPTPSSTTPSTTTSAEAPPFEQLAEIVGESPVDGLAFSPDGTVLTTRYADQTLQSWHVADQTQVGQIISTFTGSTAGAPVIGADGNTLIAMRLDDGQAVVEQWDLNSGRSSGAPFATAMPEDISDGPLLSPDGRLLAVTPQDFENPKTHVWDIASGTQIGVVNGYVAGFSQDSGTVVTWESIDRLCHVSLWDVATRQSAGAPIVLPSYEFADGFHLSDDKTELVTVSDVGVVRWWDTTSHNQTRQPVSFDVGDFDSFTFSPDGAHFVSSPGDVRVWEVDTGKPVGGLVHGVAAVAFAPDGTMATGGEDGVARLWRLP